MLVNHSVHGIDYFYRTKFPNIVFASSLPDKFIENDKLHQDGTQHSNWFAGKKRCFYVSDGD